MTGALPLAVVAVGGNALLRRGEPQTIARQRANIATASAALAAVSAGHRVVVTHGNGPQVGALAARARRPGSGRVSLDVLDAESDGQIGYLLAEGLSRHFAPDRIVVVLTRVEVDPDDPGFDRPTKPIGPVLGEVEVAELRRRTRWHFAEVEGGVRRVVPSPRPLRIVELGAIRGLVDEGYTVIAAGGGGIPVAVDSAGHLLGVEAVVDKDFSSALLAVGLGADRLALLTDVDAVYEDWTGRRARPLRRTTPSEVAGLELPEGSMGPKVAAACWFVNRTGATAVIGALDRAAAVVNGSEGTVISADDRALVGGG